MTVDPSFYTPGGSDDATDDLLTRILRLRSPASLSQTSYVDESWLGQPLAFLPMMRAAVQGGAKWLKLSVSEHSWGNDQLVAAAVATAEALGTFGELDC